MSRVAAKSAPSTPTASFFRSSVWKSAPRKPSGVGWKLTLPSETGRLAAPSRAGRAGRRSPSPDRGGRRRWPRCRGENASGRVVRPSDQTTATKGTPWEKAHGDSTSPWASQGSVGSGRRGARRARAVSTAKSLAQTRPQGANPRLSIPELRRPGTRSTNPFRRSSQASVDLAGENGLAIGLRREGAPPGTVPAVRRDEPWCPAPRRCRASGWGTPSSGTACRARPAGRSGASVPWNWTSSSSVPWTIGRSPRRPDAWGIGESAS